MGRRTQAPGRGNRAAQKSAGGTAVDEKKDTARRALLEKLGKLPPGSAGSAAKTADQWERQYEDSKIQWETERDQLNLKIQKLEMNLQRAEDSMRAEIFQEIRSQYEPKLAEANRERSRLEQEIQSLTDQIAVERERLNSRVAQLELAIPEAQESVRKQVTAELQARFDVKLEEANRLRSRAERKHLDSAEEWEGERRLVKKQIATLEGQLKEAKESAYKAQKAGNRALGQV